MRLSSLYLCIVQRAHYICQKVEREGGKQEEHFQPFPWSIIASQTPSNLVAQNSNNLLFFTILRAGWAVLLPYAVVTRTLGWLGHPNGLISNGCQGGWDANGEQSYSCQPGDLTSPWTFLWLLGILPRWQLGSKKEPSKRINSSVQKLIDLPLALCLLMSYWPRLVKWPSLNQHGGKYTGHEY